MDQIGQPLHRVHEEVGMATMQDVARAAGVSLSTVSYALSGARPVSTETKVRVADAISQLGYRRNSAATSLARRRTDVIALLYPVLPGGISSTAARMIFVAEERARAHGYELVIWPQDDPNVVVEMALEGKADAVIVMEVAVADRRVAALQESGIPVSLIGRTGDDDAVSFVDVDFDDAVEEAVSRLANLGHKSIVLINHLHQPEGARYGAAVRASAAFSAHASRLGIEGLEIQVADTRAAGSQGWQDICDGCPSATALIVMNEKASVGVVAAAHRSGRRIPDDLSVIAIVTSPEAAELVSPELSALEVRADEIGALAVEGLMSTIKGSVTPEHHLVPCDYVDRGSVTRPGAIKK